MIRLSALAFSILTIAAAGRLEEYLFYQSYGEVIVDHSGNSNWAINGEDHQNTNKNMIYAEDRGIFGDGSDRYVKGPNNSHTTNGGVDIG